MKVRLNIVVSRQMKEKLYKESLAGEVCARVSLLPQLSLRNGKGFVIVRFLYCFFFFFFFMLVRMKVNKQCDHEF